MVNGLVGDAHHMADDCRGGGRRSETCLLRVRAVVVSCKAILTLANGVLETGDAVNELPVLLQTRLTGEKSQRKVSFLHRLQSLEI